MADMTATLPLLPEECTTIADFYKSAHNTFHNIIGTVTNYGTPKKSRGTDFYMNMTLQDASGDPTGLQIRVFLPTEQLLPLLDRAGDVVLARHVRHRTGDSFAVVSRDAFQCIVFDVAHLGSGNGKAPPPRPDDLVYKMSGHDGPPPSLEEKAYAIALRLGAAMGPQSKGPGGLGVMASSSREKFSLIRDVEANKFVDIVGEVVKIWDNIGQYLDVYVTDYTTNKLLWEHRRTSYGDQWAGPEGRMTLKVEVHPPHSEWVNSNVHMNDIVLLKNTRIKMSKHNDELQGTLWEDKLRPSKISVEVPPKSDPRVLAVMQKRKQHYGGKELNVPGSDTGKLSRTQQKKLKKRKREDAEAAEKASRLDDKDLGLYRYRLNPKKDSRPITSFHDVVFNHYREEAQVQGGSTKALPFVNVKHQVHLRVVDYFPHDIRAFVERENDGYTWSFCLSVVAGDPKESEKRPIQILVRGAAAEAFLDMEATSIVGDNTGLAKLRAKLWQLWGDLEEKKLANRPRINYLDTDYVANREGLIADNMAFEACLSESGVEVSSTGEWNRLWHLFGTKIV